MESCKYSNMPERDRKNFIDQALNKIKEAHEKFGHSLFFNPRDFPDRLYTKEEVLGLLQFFGHSGVPKQAENGYPEIPPSTVNVTARSFQKITWGSLNNKRDVEQKDLNNQIEGMC
jgi:hypothetical protein